MSLYKICHSYRELEEKTSYWRRILGNKVVTTNGCFDILHSGHIKLLKAARELGEVLVVGLNSDESVRRLKGESRPIRNEEERADLLSELPFVDFIIVFQEEDPREFIRNVKPDIHVQNINYKNNCIEESVVQGIGAKMVFVKTNNQSTTEIVNRVLEKGIINVGE